MKLSDNFLLSEMTASTTAVVKHIPNIPNAQQTKNLEVLCKQCLERVRRLFGNKPVRVTSGFRSVALNTAIGGSKTSHHCQGYAADFVISGFTVADIVKKIKQTDTIKYTQLIEEHSGNSSWVHISYVPANLKRETLLYKNGKYTRL